MSNEIKVGRSGSFYVQEDGCAVLSLEIKYWSGRPKLERFIEYDKKVTVSPHSCPRSNSGNGIDQYTLEQFGVYVARGVIATSRDVATKYLLFNEDGVEELSDQDLDDVLRDQFPASAQAYEHEVARRKRLEEERKRLERAIVEERDQFEEVVSEEGYTATPEFPQIPANIAERQEDEEELVVEFGTPSAYVVNTPCYASEKTAEEAIKKAREKYQQREENIAKSKEIAKQKKWPKLKGSKRQVRWAEQIRVIGFEKGCVSEDELKNKKEASFWIDSYKHLTR
ncbi:hypothetical protein LRF89_13050 [Halorhodospira sp. 9621]|nr:MULTISPECIES: hypothetical protein [Halorhodospira]MCG5529240.1 hypothetical protein [Halorhodospira halophila]MCG5534360.1 hypothetical protein [Halorhodospira sp. 9621]MCG5543089.1 hypothetical protein [Halorhodospira sp. 9628]MCG5543096.1 hypothetical protein [Halorhodospira sp. 9628]